MIESDTIKLLRECDSGIKMGVSAIEDSMKHAKNKKLRCILEKSKNQHNEINVELLKLLNKYYDHGKNPPVMSKVMSRIKTDVKMAFKDNDEAVAESIKDGCDMGIKYLSKYLNEYKAADERSKDIAKKLIVIEEKLAEQMRGYL